MLPYSQHKARPPGSVQPLVGEDMMSIPSLSGSPSLTVVTSALGSSQGLAALGYLPGLVSLLYPGHCPSS